MGFSRSAVRLAFLVVVAAASLASSHVARVVAVGGAAPGRAGLIVFAQAINTIGGPLDAAWTIRPDGTGLRKLFDGGADSFYSPRISPNGRKIAYSDGGGTVYVMNSDGTKDKAVCPARCDSPIAWSPDGHRLAVGTGNWRRPGLGIFDLRSRRLRVLSSLPSADYFDWSPDGRKLAVSDEQKRIWLIHPDGTHAVVIARGFAGPRWSPDGKLLLVSGDKSIGTIPSSGGKFTRLLHIDTYAVWSPDGRQIVYISHGIRVRDLRSSRDYELNRRTRTVCDQPDRASGEGSTYCYDLDAR